MGDKKFVYKFNLREYSDVTVKLYYKVSGSGNLTNGKVLESGSVNYMNCHVNKKLWEELIAHFP
jgi:hypothetical protein